jgi:hypothetical protein
MGDMMETQSDSIDISSIKFAALEAFEVSFNAAARFSATADGVIFPASSPRKRQVSNQTCLAMIALTLFSKLSSVQSLRRQRQRHHRHRTLSVRPWAEAHSLYNM